MGRLTLSRLRHVEQNDLVSSPPLESIYVRDLTSTVDSVGGQLERGSEQPNRHIERLHEDPAYFSALIKKPTEKEPALLLLTFL